MSSEVDVSFTITFRFKQKYEGQHSDENLSDMAIADSEDIVYNVACEPITDFFARLAKIEGLTVEIDDMGGDTWVNVDDINDVCDNCSKGAVTLLPFGTKLVCQDCFDRLDGN